MIKPASAKCPECDCEYTSPYGFDDSENVFVNAIGTLVATGEGLPRSGGCERACPCHTGVGLMPRLQFTVL